MNAGRGIRWIAIAAIAFAACAPAALAEEAADPGSPAEARAEAVLAKAQAAIAGPQADEPTRELTLVLAELSQAVPALHGKERRAANRILARPDDGFADRYGDGYTVDEPAESPFCDANFCVHWVESTKDKPDPTDVNTNDVPDYVEDVLASAQDSFDVENTELGWIEPLGDGSRGGGSGTNKTDIYLLEFNGRYFGYSSPDEGQGPATAKQAYLVLDNDYEEFVSADLTATEALQVTMAHEYNHVLQFAYDSQEDIWMFEATAVWMENQVYPSIDDWTNFVPYYANGLLVPLTDPRGLRIYGAAVWNHFLAETGDPAVVRDAWDVSPDVTPAHLSVAAYDDALGGTGDPFAAFGDTFVDFAASTAEWRGNTGAYPDAALLPDMERVGRLKLDGHARTIKLDHLSYALLNVHASAGHANDLELHITAPDGTHSGVAIIGRRGPATSADLSSSIGNLSDGGPDQESISADPDYKRITAVIINADGRVKASGRYARNGQRYRVKLVSG
jgi:hypothetical protein